MGLRADKGDLQRLKYAFKMLDKDNNGYLSVDEIKSSEYELTGFGLGDKWSTVLKKCDLNGDGKIDFQEFFTAAINHQKLCTEENITELFDMLDKNHDGTIDVEEFNTQLPSHRHSTRKPTLRTTLKKMKK